MIRNAFAALGALSVLACAFGCTPSPDSTCAKIVDLANKELSAGKMLDARKTKLKDRCLTDLTKMDDEDSEAYQCVAKCVRAVQDLDGADKCMLVCSHKEKPKDAPK